MGQEQAKTTLSEPSMFSETRMSIPKNSHLSPTCFNRFLLHENSFLKDVNDLLSRPKHGNQQFAEPTPAITNALCHSLYDDSCGVAGDNGAEYCHCGNAWNENERDGPSFRPKSQQDCDQHYDKACKWDDVWTVCNCPGDASKKQGKS